MEKVDFYKTDGGNYYGKNASEQNKICWYKIYLIFFILINFTLNIYRHFTAEDVNYGLQWQNVEMLMTYRYGFVRRGFLGTVALVISELFNIERYAAVEFVQLVGEIILCIMITALMIYVIKSCTSDTAKIIVIILSAVFTQWGVQLLHI